MKIDGDDLDSIHRHIQHIKEKWKLQVHNNQLERVEQDSA